MSKRLLSEEVALRKIELSLKLQGKAFKPEFVGCPHCKFYWANRNDRPQWIFKYSIHNPKKPNDPPENPKPEKYHWNCYHYKNTPYHAYLRFKVVRFNKDGVEIPRKPHYNTEKLCWDYTPGKDEYDKMILISSGKHWTRVVCKRFEACSAK